MATEILKSKDFATDQDVRWCPGCGDYSILKQVQQVMADTGRDPQDIVFISGIGCAARFPYYMETYGMHGIHGRAPALASGLKSVNKDLSVWVVTGDGDCLSIGGNHFIHLLRRNFDLNLLLFNNEIYGLTKGQYSPTSPLGRRTGSSPMGVIDTPFRPIELAFGAKGTFIARSMDRDPKHLREVLQHANDHKGTSFVEIYQNCNVFNDGAFFTFTEKATKKQNALFLIQGEPLVFGEHEEWGIRLNDLKPEVVSLEKYSKDDLWIHDAKDRFKATVLCQFDDLKNGSTPFPRPFGIIYQEDRPTYEDQLDNLHEQAVVEKGSGKLDQLLAGSRVWGIK
ncbi:MAG: 2-oxoacid:ferredoxin oxidoreductase subunit beta [Cyclobacteriaceae bacterium]|nr:2-oxoacid:ferredoxin oxidoreductase subunit beta [Cyclobacteriaceae bacterium SS2]